MPKRKTIIWIGLILTFCFLVAITSVFFYSLKRPSALPVESPQPSEETLPQLPPLEMTLYLYNGKIEPDYFKVKAGQIISLTIVSMEGRHSLKIEGKNFSFSTQEFSQPGETFYTTLTAPREKGEYQIFCTQEGHKEQGEKGIMVVE